MNGNAKAEKGSKEHMKNRLINTGYSSKMQKKCVDKGGNLFYLKIATC